LNGIAASVGEMAHGFQATGVYSRVGGEVRGVQASGLFSDAGASVRGLQVAALRNRAGGTLSGMQLAAVNTAHEARGVQLGFANAARVAGGVQIGALNLLGEARGVPIGMINTANDGAWDWVAYGSNLTAANAGVRTTVRRLYSMLTAGMPDLEEGVPTTVVLTWNYGYTVFGSGDWMAGLDIGFAHYIPTEAADPGENGDLHFGVQARGILERRFGARLGVFAGAGIGRVYAEYDLGSPSTTRGLFFGGVSVRRARPGRVNGRSSRSPAGWSAWSSGEPRSR
jgi:hypothetical protein